MHEIYKAAYATIVQSSGYDADSGLPGVRPASRSLIVAELKLSSKADTSSDGSDNMSLSDTSSLSSRTLSSIGSIMDSDETSYGSFVAIPEFQCSALLRNNIHSTRGWTLQETLLSRRCIYFFEKQTIFICSQDIYQDCFSRPQLEGDAVFAYGDIRSTKDFIPWQMNPLQPFSGRRDFPHQNLWLEYFESYARVITDYNRRQLSYSEDVLSAFSGLGEAMAARTGTSMHFAMPSSSFDLALLWTSVGDLRRRTEIFREAGGKLLPSWCWASWYGDITYNLCETRGPPSEFHQLSSYIRSFQLQDVSQTILLKRDPWPPHNRSRRVGSALYTLYENVEDPTNVPYPDIQCPIGCLSFWSEESIPGSIFWSSEHAGTGSSKTANTNLFSFLYDQTSHQRIGILALPHSSELDASTDGNKSEYSYVLLSECPNAFEKWPICNAKGLAKVRPNQFCSHILFQHPNLQYFVNVLLVRRCGAFVERIAFGQIYLGSWVNIKRRRRYFRMI
jgi:hypothetical protein